MKYRFLLIIIMSALSLFLTASQAPRIVEGPKELPHITAAMLDATFWISRCKNPDLLLLSQQECYQRNEKWQKQGLILPIFDLPDKIAKQQLHLWIKEDFSYLERVGRYNEKGELLTSTDYKKIKVNMNLDALQGSNFTKHGMTVCQTGLKLFPTDKIITTKPLEVEFSIVPHSRLRLAEPVVVLFASKDQKWYFVAAQVGRGWVKQKHVALARHKVEVEDYIKKANFIVISNRTYFTIKGRKKPIQAFMGAQVTSDEDQKDQYKLPIRLKDGSLAFSTARVGRLSDIHNGPLALTQRNILTQAFKLLNETYGWGGDSGFGDCSEFIRRIGLSCGLHLPRSTSSLKAGLNKSNIIMKKLALSLPGQTLITLPGHVMMVVGEIEGRLFVIHNLYGIHGTDRQGDYIKKIARIIVSDLSLGAGSRKGSLLDRLDYKLEIK